LLEVGGVYVNLTESDLGLSDRYPLNKAYRYEEFFQVENIYDDIPYVMDFLNTMQTNINDSYNSLQGEISDESLHLYNQCLFGAWIVQQKYPMATIGLLHYLDNTGEMFYVNLHQLIATIDVQGLIYHYSLNDVIRWQLLNNVALELYSPIATYYYYYNLLELLKFAASVLKDGESFNIMQIPIDEDHKIVSYTANNILFAFADLDYTMFLGTGGSSAGITANVSRNGDSYIVTYRYCVYDAYDWSIDFSFLPGFPTDSSMHRLLHESGLACEYLVYGEMIDTYTINESVIGGYL